MNWEIFIQGFGALIAAVIGISQITNRLSKSRSLLKNDLEVLELLDKDKQPDSYKLVKASIDTRIQKLYEGQKRKPYFGVRIYNQDDFLGGAICFLGGMIWTIYLLSLPERSGWLYLSIFLILAGIGGLVTGLSDEQEEKE